MARPLGCLGPTPKLKEKEGTPLTLVTILGFCFSLFFPWLPPTHKLTDHSCYGSIWHCRESWLAGEEGGVCPHCVTCLQAAK